MRAHINSDAKLVVDASRRGTDHEVKCMRMRAWLGKDSERGDGSTFPYHLLSAPLLQKAYSDHPHGFRQKGSMRAELGTQLVGPSAK